jgi:heterodisulfide reductase subunit A
MRSYGDFEGFYEKLRQVSGINFVRGRPSEVVRRDGKLIVMTEDTILGENLEIEADCVVLSTGFVPDEELLRKLRIPVDGGFPRDYIDSCLSVDSNPRGIFIAGSAAFPQSVSETIADARDVAVSVVELLSKDLVELKTPIPSVNNEICSALKCEICLTVCPYGAIQEVEEEIQVNESMCMGCGVCTATCAAGANQLEGYTHSELLAQIRGTIAEGDIAAFLCQWSAYNAADKAGYERLDYPESVRIIRVPCTGRVDVQMILCAFALGAKGVLIGGCYPDSCHYISGNLKARRRTLALTTELLEQFGVNPNRLRIEWIGKRESRKLSEVLREMDKGFP